MHKTIRGAAAAVAACAAVGGLGLEGAGPAGAAARADLTSIHLVAVRHHAVAAPGTQLWVRRYSSPGKNIDDYASAVAVGPHAGRLFVTGTAAGVMSGQWAVTIAYSAVTGRQLWLSSRGDASAADLAVSPDGRTVFVTGQAQRRSSGTDVVTVAYGTATGRTLWRARYSGPSGTQAAGNSVAVSPDGKTVYVTGSSWPRASSGASPDIDYLTVAYSAATGRQLWASRYDGPATAGSIDEAAAIAVGPRGGTVYVTGRSVGVGSGSDYATVAYAASTGRQLWVKRFSRRGGDEAVSLAVSPSGRTIFVTGRSRGGTRTFDYVTVAYNAANGARRWMQFYNGPHSGRDGASSVAVSPDGSAVFVTGRSSRAAATVAYSAAVRSRLWVKRYTGPAAGDAFGMSVTVSPDGRTVLVAGGSLAGYLTIAYDAATGARQWLRNYRGPGSTGGNATSITIGPGGHKVFVNGRSPGRDNLGDFATIAYSN